LGAEAAQAGIAICQRLATEAKSIGTIAAAVLGIPDDEQGRHVAKCRFYRMKVASSALASLYARAREARADMLVDEIVEIADEPLPECSDPVELKAETERRRLMIDARKWAAGKMNRLLYSDNPERGGVQVNVNTYDDGRATLELLNQRLHPRPKHAREAVQVLYDPSPPLIVVPELCVRTHDADPEPTTLNSRSLRQLALQLRPL
jgi:hypothetical protein